MAEHPTAFAPVDITDGRSEGTWKTRYPKQAWFFIVPEAVYLLSLLFSAPILIALACSGKPARWFGIDELQYNAAIPSICAWFGGMLGGTLFDLKWLYHSVAKEIWNVDRILWRVLIPHLSAALAFATLLLVGSGVIKVFDVTATKSPALCIGLAFLVGYFSDMAVAKLTEVAKTLFGPARDQDHQPVKGSDVASPATSVNNGMQQTPNPTRTAG